MLAAKAVDNVVGDRVVRGLARVECGQFFGSSFPGADDACASGQAIEGGQGCPVEIGLFLAPVFPVIERRVFRQRTA